MPTSKISNTERQERRIAAFFALSLLIHGLLFFAFSRWQREDMPRAAAARSVPLSVRLLEARPAPLPQALPTPTPPIAKAEPAPRPKPAARPLIAKRKPAPARIAKLEPPAPARETPAPPPAPKDVRPPEPQMDMLTMLNAARERRRAAQQSAALEDEQAPASSANDVALANINRDLQRYSGSKSGTGDVYVRLISQGVRTAQFQIRGRNPVSGDSWRHTIDVDAGPDGDVKVATVQKMIEWIRAHYSGDFIWESDRLGRSFLLSARPRDNAELEAFLMREFFVS